MKKQLFSDRLKYCLSVHYLKVVLLVGIFLAQLTINGVYAQTATITGKVSDVLGPLTGVSVKLEVSAGGVSTDASGNYNINAPADGKLIFTYIGYTTQTVSINDRRTIDVVMVAESTSLTEVVVVGYGTQKKVSLTGAVSEIKGEELTRRPVSSIQQALQGQLPGLTILDQGGSPGNSNTTMRIRGITTLSSNNPLVIVDGIEQPLANINPDDIESISVLKDASSTAIYGSRAANGVILITSKRATAGKATVTYNGFYAEQKSVSKPEHMDIESYLRLQNTNYINSGAPARYTEQQISDYVNGDREQFPLPFDWYNVMLRTAPQVNHSLAVSGGSENFKGRLSLRYQDQDQDGTIANTNSKINEIRVNTDLKVSPKINVAGDVNYRYVNSIQPQNITEIFRLMMQNSIFTVPKYADGTYGAGPQGNNPLLLAEEGGTDKAKNDYVTGNIKGDWEIIKGLKFTTQLGARIISNSGKEFVTSYEIRDHVNPTIVRKARPLNTLQETRNSSKELTLNSFLNYTTVLDKHSLGALAGYSEIQNSGNSLSAFRQGFYNNDIQALGQGTNDATKNNGGSESDWGLRSYFGRLNYSFQDKYLFEANARYDGSSRFSGNNRYSFFPSFSAGWRLSEEKFWGGLGNYINEFKIRGSWGKTGNQAVDLYSYYSTLNLVTYSFSGAPVQGYTQQQLSSEDLTWETTTQTNIGLDAQFLNNKMSLGVDYYEKRTDGILLLLPVPATLGLQASPQNAGIVDNKGWEFSAGIRNKFGEFGLDVNLNFNINDNNVVDLAGTGPYITGTDIDPRYLTGEGYPIDSFWGYQTNGFFQTQAEANSSPVFIRPAQPGDINYVDLNGDGKIDPNDMTFVGNPFPKHTFGSSLNLTYKGFGLNMLFQGASGHEVQLTRALVQSGTAEAFTHKIYTNNFWTPENPGARFPRSIKFETRNQVNSDFNTIDGDYIRLKNIQLQYQIPASLTNRLFIERMSVYVSGTNLLTFSKLNEWNLDPEKVSGWENYYPQVSLYTLGFNLQF